MRWVLLGVATLVAAAAALVGVAPSNPLPTSVSAPAVLRPVAYVPSPGSVQARFVELVNRERAAHGCARTVTANAALVTSARRHNNRMADAGILSHTLPGEPRLLPRIERAGYTNSALVAENIAYGFTSAEGVVRRWMRSTMHRSVLLECRLRHIGAAKTTAGGTTWWTVDFGQRR